MGARSYQALSSAGTWCEWTDVSCTNSYSSVHKGSCLPGSGNRDSHSGYEFPVTPVCHNRNKIRRENKSFLENNKNGSRLGWLYWKTHSMLPWFVIFFFYRGKNILSDYGVDSLLLHFSTRGMLVFLKIHCILKITLLTEKISLWGKNVFWKTNKQSKC